MKRREFCFFAGATYSTILLSSCQSNHAENADLVPFTSIQLRDAIDSSQIAQKPNVLFISIDDLNDWVGALGGHPQAKTPNLDRLAKQGINFTKAYCAAPACNPSRTAVLTGIPPHVSGVYDNPQDWQAALPDVVTLPQLFQRSGYWVGGAGKLYHAHFFETEGWDELYPLKTREHGMFRDIVKASEMGQSPKPKNRPLNGIPDESGLNIFDWGAVDADAEEMTDAKVAAWVSEQLQQPPEARENRPFFLACGLFRPHLPWYIPQKYLDAFPLEDVQLPVIQANDLDDIPSPGIKLAKPDKDHANVTAQDEYRKAVQAYLASIYFVDEMLGRVLDALEASAYADNTIVALWSDHGWHLGEKLHWRKFTLWEEATRVPMIFKLPGGISGGAPEKKTVGNCDRPVNLLDLYPTLADLCGLKPPETVAGNSLVSLLQNPATPWEYPAVTSWYRHTSVRSEQFRLIQYDDGSQELYDHNIDPHEWTNLAEKSEFEGTIVELSQWIPKAFAPDAPKARSTRRLVRQIIDKL